jgi:hypothetical protein
VGNPINGDVDIVYRLYHEASDGTALWTEEHTGAKAVPVDGGLFHVLLGSITPLDPGQLTGDEEMTPRELLTSVYHAVGQVIWRQTTLRMSRPIPVVSRSRTKMVGR